MLLTGSGPGLLKLVQACSDRGSGGRLEDVVISEVIFRLERFVGIGYLTRLSCSAPHSPQRFLQC